MHFFLQNGLRFLITGIAFAMTLVLTPRAFVDSDRYASSKEIPVRALEQPDNCVWCTPPSYFAPTDCADSEDNLRIWLHPDQIMSDTPEAPCPSDQEASGPGA